MRKISLVFLSAVFLATTSLSAAGPEPATSASKKLSTQIAQLLEDHTLEVDKDLTATVMITINEESEIVVISVDTKNETLEKVLKAKLNYEKVDLAPQNSGKLFKVPVRIEA